MSVMTPLARRVLPVLAVVIPPLVISAIGLAHPAKFTGAVAPWWTTLHIILLPLFPLLGLVVWVLVRGRRDVLAWLARSCAFLFIPLYTALDALAGIGAGTLKVNDATTHAAGGARNLFAIANSIGTVGGYLLFAALVLALASLVRDRSTWGLFATGGLLLLVGSFFFAEHHIYWPVGGLSVLLIGVGAGLVELAREAPVPAPQAGNPISGGSAS